MSRLLCQTELPRHGITSMKNIKVSANSSEALPKLYVLEGVGEELPRQISKYYSTTDFHIEVKIYAD